MQIEDRKSILLLVSGPAGCGKTTVCKALLSEYKSEIERAVTATTRGARGEEIHGKDYYFLSKEDFIQRIERDGFYEHAQVHENYYGVPKEEVLQRLEAGTDLLLNVDVQGAASFRKAAEEDPRLQGRLATVFIMPSSIDVIHERMTKRGEDTAEVIEKRLKKAEWEITHHKDYDYVLISGSMEEDQKRFFSIYEAEKMKASRLFR